MGEYELVERLCGVTAVLADVVKEQAAIIAQADIPDSTKVELEQRRKAVYSELDIIWQRHRRKDT